MLSLPTSLAQSGVHKLMSLCRSQHTNKVNICKSQRVLLISTDVENKRQTSPPHVQTQACWCAIHVASVQTACVLLQNIDKL